jgi:biopolymer transport protein ExbD
MPSITSLVALVIFVIVIALALYSIKSEITEWSNNNKQPENELFVVLIEKDMRTKTIERTKKAEQINNRTNSMSAQKTTNTLVFKEKTSNSTQAFTVKNSIFMRFNEGDTGTLRHQGTRFLSFEPDNEP